MNPARKRTVRLIVALSAAVVLGERRLIYTSFQRAESGAQPEPAGNAKRSPAAGLSADGPAVATDR